MRTTQEFQMGLLRSRRQFLTDMGAVAVGAVAASSPVFALHDPSREKPRVGDMKSPFQLGVITDEVSQDFGHACEVIAKDFGLNWIEIRAAWNKNAMKFDGHEIAEAKSIIARYNLRVAGISSPLFKTDWPGAPVSKFSPPRDQFGANFTFDQQDEVFDRCMELASEFKTSRVRCFDFWRLDDPVPYRAAMNQKLLDTAGRAGMEGITLVLENEPACNTATGAEAAKVLEAVQSPFFMLNWDPGNAVAAGEKAFPEGYNLLPKNRIGHCHCKDALINASGKSEWAAVGRGSIDWAGQFCALKNDGYKLAVTLETHWRGAGTAEESSRQSWAGMRSALEKAGAVQE
jgi:sugar phosphate isomerase/epimerase